MAGSQRSPREAQGVLLQEHSRFVATKWQELEIEEVDFRCGQHGEVRGEFPLGGGARHDGIFLPDLSAGRCQAHSL